MSKLAPLVLASVTAPVAARLPPAPSASVPALIVVPPVYVFAPVNVNVPVPDCVSVPVPETTPP